MSLDAFAESVTHAFFLARQTPYVQRHSGDDLVHGLPYAMFQVCPELHLQDLHLSLYCYYMKPKIGWMRLVRSVLSLKKPSLWQRLWNNYPLLRLSVAVQQVDTQIDIQRAGDVRHLCESKLNCQLYLTSQQIAVIEQLVA